MCGEEAAISASPQEVGAGAPTGCRWTCYFMPSFLSSHEGIWPFLSTRSCKTATVIQY